MQRFWCVYWLHQTIRLGCLDVWDLPFVHGTQLYLLTVLRLEQEVEGFLASGEPELHFPLTLSAYQVLPTMINAKHIHQGSVVRLT